MGVTECDNMLMLLAVSTKMTEKERDVVVPLMMRGFKVNIFYLLFCLYLGSTSLVFVCIKGSAKSPKLKQNIAGSKKNFNSRTAPWRPTPPSPEAKLL
jgi:hypothetical protein